jgi:formylglycine-generating enzyme required for sulfatase activity
MTTIPAGAFWMGVEGIIGLEDEKPRHRVWLMPTGWISTK